MCVLTYIPTKNGYIITSNRDEATARAAAVPPRKYHLSGNDLCFPKDPQGGGTWIATDGSTTACLLNGGYKSHVRKLPYRQSRGLVVTDFFKYDSVEDFYGEYLFAGIEPFTLVIFSQHASKIKEIRWTGEKADLNSFDSSVPQIWSSATLYSDTVIKERQNWFSEFLKSKKTCAEDILHFHHFGGKGDERNDIKMNRAGVLKTVAITQFEIKESSFAINYEDLQKGKFSELVGEKGSVLSD